MHRICLSTRVLLFLLLAFVLVVPVQAQLYLSEGSYNGPIPQGPANKVAAVQLLKRGENGKFVAPDVNTTVKLSISNAQIAADGISEVLSFGSNSRETLKWPSSEFVFREMKALGSPLSSFFTAGSQLNEGMVTSSNFGYWLFASVKHLSKSSFPKVGESQYLADVTMTFNRAVANPVIHLVGMGGIVTVEGITRGFSVELELVHPSAYLEMVSGSKEFGVNPDRIYNTADRFDGNCGAGAACGSVRVIGSNLTELTFKVHLRRDTRENGYRGRWPLMRNMQGGDGFLVSVSFDDNGSVSGQVNTRTEMDTRGSNKLNEKLLRVNLLDPIDQRVLASKPVENDGSFAFDGLTLYNQYAIQINTLKGMVGEKAPKVELPDGWKSMSMDQTKLMEEPLPAPHLFVLETKAQSGFDFHLTNLTESQIAGVSEQADQIPLEKTPTEIYLEEREKLAAAKLEEAKETPAPIQTDEPVEAQVAEAVADILEEEVPAEEPESITEVNPDEGVEETVTVESAPTEIVTESTPEEKRTESHPPISQKNYVSMDAIPHQEVIIVGSGQNERGIAYLQQKLVANGREVYRGKGPNGMLRIGFYVGEADVDSELQWAKTNIVSDAWILDQPAGDVKKKLNDNTPEGQSMGDCLIIVGSFARLQNVERMFQRLMSAGLTPYKGDGPGQLTRVGFYVDCLRRFQELNEARKKFDAGSWVIPQIPN